AITTIKTIATIKETHIEYKNKQQIHDESKVLNKTENIRKDQEREENTRRLRQEREDREGNKRRLRQEREKNIRKELERKERERKERERKERQTRENIRLERERKFKDELPLKAVKAVFFICGLFFIYMIGSTFKDDSSEALTLIIVLGGLFVLVSVVSFFVVLVSDFPYWFRRSLKKENNFQRKKATTSDSHDETKDTVPNPDVINRGDNLITELEGSDLIIICKHCST
ncbi:MAG: hypothetical protein VW299_05955, partial [Alphaproteobacteria bacterium]